TGIAVLAVGARPVPVNVTAPDPVPSNLMIASVTGNRVFASLGATMTPSSTTSSTPNCLTVHPVSGLSTLLGKATSIVPLSARTYANPPCSVTSSVVLRQPDATIATATTTTTSAAHTHQRPRLLLILSSVCSRQSRGQWALPSATNAPQFLGDASTGLPPR